MLGSYGCRLGIVFPILPEMQVRAIATAAARLKKEGLDPKPEVMIPLVSVKAASSRSCAASPSRSSTRSRPPRASSSTSRSAP